LRPSNISRFTSKGAGFPLLQPKRGAVNACHVLWEPEAGDRLR
jgi:hypothetical protein